MNEISGKSVDLYDAIVIGAGPAGAVSAFRLAQAGWRVLLLERARWPRQKVCGGCVNARAISLLRSIGIALSDRSSSRYSAGILEHNIIDRCTIDVGDASVTVPLPFGGAAIERRTLDAALVDRAIAAGAQFIDEASASVVAHAADHFAGGDRQTVIVRRDGDTFQIHARRVLVADGINGTSLSHHPWANWSIAGDSYIGVSATVPADSTAVSGGAIHMSVIDGGYVGRVRQADATIHVAAALDPKLCQHAGSPALLIARQMNDPSLALQRWTGIGKLTRHRQQVAAGRVMLLGDACGYVEPFTGEGIAWAIDSAIEATDLLLSADHSCLSLAGQWQRRHARTIGRRQRGCRVVRFFLRHSALRACMMAAMETWPPAVGWFASPRFQPTSIREAAPA